MTHFYTRFGDEGFTGLLGEGRVPKYHPIPEAVGNIDEATAAIGLARAVVSHPLIGPLLIQIQRDLYSIMAEVSATPDNAAQFRKINSERVVWLEQETDAVSKLIEIPKEFILPGDTISGAQLDLARTIVRRAERGIAKLLHDGSIENLDLLKYLNRLSSTLFVLELLENTSHGLTKPSLAKG